MLKFKKDIALAAYIPFLCKRSELPSLLKTLHKLLIQIIQLFITEYSQHLKILISETFD